MTEQQHPLVPPTPLSVPELPKPLPVALKVAAGVEFPTAVAFSLAIAFEVLRDWSWTDSTGALPIIIGIIMPFVFHMPVGIGLLQRSRVAFVVAFFIHGLMTFLSYFMRLLNGAFFFFYLFTTLLLCYCLLRPDVRKAFKGDYD